MGGPKTWGHSFARDRRAKKIRHFFPWNLAHAREGAAFRSRSLTVSSGEFDAGHHHHHHHHRRRRRSIYSRSGCGLLRAKLCRPRIGMRQYSFISMPSVVCMMHTWSVQKVSRFSEYLKKGKSYGDKIWCALRGHLTRYPCTSAILCVNPLDNGISLSGGMFGVSVTFSYLRDTDSLHNLSDLWEYLEFLKSRLDKTW